MLKKMYRAIFLNVILLGIIFPLMTQRVLSQSTIRVVNAVNWSSDGIDLAIGYSDGLVQIIDTLKGQEIFTSNYFEVSRTLAWSPTDRSLLAIGGTHIEKSQSEVIVLNTATGEAKSILVTDASISSVAWSPDGSKLGIVKAPITISYTSRNELEIWDVKSVQMLLSSPSPSVEDNITSIAWSPDGKHIAGAITNQTVVIWDTSTGKESLVLRGHKDVVLSVDWSPDGTQIATTGSISDNTVRIWEAVSGQNVASYEAHSATVKWSPDGNELALAEYLKVRILDAKSGAEVLNATSSGLESALDYSPFGGRLAFGGAEGTSSLTPIYNFSKGAVEIITPNSSKEKLQSITQLCSVESTLKQSLDTLAISNNIQGFITQVSALTDTQIPPGCKADLLAVANALMAKAQ